MYFTGVACTTTRNVMGKLLITVLLSSDGAVSTDSTTGSFATRGAPVGGSPVTVEFNGASTNAESKPIPPTLCPNK